MSQKEYRRIWDIKTLSKVKKERDDALRELEDWNDSSKIVLDEKCPSDEKHCSCVVFLRTEIDGLESMLAGNEDFIEHQKRDLLASEIESEVFFRRAEKAEAQVKTMRENPDEFGHAADANECLRAKLKDSETKRMKQRLTLANLQDLYNTKKSEVKALSLNLEALRDGCAACSSSSGVSEFHTGKDPATRQLDEARIHRSTALMDIVVRMGGDPLGGLTENEAFEQLVSLQDREINVTKYKQEQNRKELDDGARAEEREKWALWMTARRRGYAAWTGWDIANLLRGGKSHNDEKKS